MPKVSIIVPVYNAEKYLQECVESVLCQTLSDIELILVDDGSTDSSPALCDQYAVKDARVRVIHQKNAGLASARNVGIQVATGQYLAFLDSDDFVDTNMYETMVDSAEAENAPLVICTGFYYSGTHKNRISPVGSIPRLCMNSKEFVKRWLWTSNETTVLFTVVWNKLYLRDFFADDLFFEALRIHEDEEFSTRLFLKDFKIIFLDEPFYYYRANQESVTYRPFAEVNLCILDVLYKRSQAYQNCGWIELSRHAAKNFCEVYIDCLRKASDIGHPEWLKQYRRNFREMRMIVGIRNHIKDQIRYQICSASPHVYKNLFQ